MTELFIYLLKAAVINAILLGFYYFSFRKTNRFSLMRITLLSAMILPLLLPFIPLSGTASKALTVNTAVLAIELPVTLVQHGYNEALSVWPPMHEFIYYLVAVTFLIGMIFSIISIFRKKVRSVKYPTNFGDILLENTVRTPFSFFDWVFLSRPDLDHPQLDMLLKHEFCHVNEKHSLDRIIAGIFRSVLWFSPFAHITARRLVEVHEYQADANVLQAQVSPSEYSDLVLSFYLNNLSTRGVSNNFSFHIKNRIAMINNLNVGRLKIGRIIFGLSFSLLAMLATSALQSSIPIIESQSETLNINYTTGDTVPPYPTIEYKWLKKQRNTDAIKGLNGKVIISIQIDEVGNATDYAIHQSAGSKLDDYAMQLVKEFKGWNPARVNNKPVSYNLLYPVTFPASEQVESDEQSDKLLLEQDPDTIKKNVSQKQEEKQLEKEQAKIKAKQEKIKEEQGIIDSEQKKAQRDQAKIGAEQEQIQSEQSKIEAEHKIIEKEHAKIEKKHAEIEKEHAKMEKEHAKIEKEQLKKEMEFKQKQVEYLEKAQKAEAEQKTKGKEKNKKVYSEVDKMPQYPGGYDALVEYLSSKIKYPDKERKEGIEGTVYVSFLVGEDGKVSEVKAIRGIDKELDEIAVQAVMSMPDWEPGEKDGKRVVTSYTLPIKFALSKEPKK